MNRITQYCLGIVLSVTPVLAQAQSLSIPTEGGSPRAVVGERIGLTDISISYGRPTLRGRAGKIWGQLVHYGFQRLDYGTSKAAPWRAGANENTVFTTSSDLLVEGKTLPAGRYGLFMAVYPDSVSIIFSRNNTAWGSYFYEPSADVLRVIVRPRKNQPITERLTYVVDSQNDSTATIRLHWENWTIPFRVSVNLNQTVIASIRQELVSGKSEQYLNWVQAATYGLTHNIVNDEVLGWANQAISMPYIGQRNFLTLSTKAEVLSRLGKRVQADSLWRQALSIGSVQEIHQYGRRLLNENKSTEALAVFRQNALRYPNVYTTNIGLARGYSAIGDSKQALKYARVAFAQAPDEPNRQAVTKLIETLSANQ